MQAKGTAGMELYVTYLYVRHLLATVPDHTTQIGVKTHDQVTTPQQWLIQGHKIPDITAPISWQQGWIKDTKLNNWKL